LYRFESEIPPVVNLRLKIEINTREHFNGLGLQEFPFRVESSWFSGSATINTYKLEELLGTKLRALYQRRKGRDLFDLFWALKQNNVNLNQVLECYQKYMNFVVDKVPTQKQFLVNMEEKMQDNEFLSDMRDIIRPDIEYSPVEAWNMVRTRLVDYI
jgi:predicted nucleotidyltransferase component of viral defense system